MRNAIYAYIFFHCFCLSFQVSVSPFEAASSIIIEFDMENDIFGLPRELVVASAGRQIKG